MLLLSRLKKNAHVNNTAFFRLFFLVTIETLAQFKVLGTQASKDGQSNMKLLPNSNVTIIQKIRPLILSNERNNRRTDILDFEVMSKQEIPNSNLLKLHILNLRTGKIQDILITSSADTEIISAPYSTRHSESLLNDGKSTGEFKRNCN